MNQYFISQYALTQGIFTVEAEVCTSINENMISTNGKGLGGSACYHKPHWHETEQEAIAQAENMRVKKIASLKKQMAKLEALKFTD